MWGGVVPLTIGRHSTLKDCGKRASRGLPAGVCMTKGSYYQLIDELNASAKAGFVDNITYKKDKTLQKITVKFSHLITPKQLTLVHKHLKEKYGPSTIVLAAIDPNTSNTILMYVYEPQVKTGGNHESP